MSSSSDTDRVIRSIAREAGARRGGISLEAALLLAALAALGIGAALVLLSGGVRPDLQAVMLGAPFRHKLASMLALACGGIFLVASLGRPGASRLWIVALLPGLLLLANGAVGDQSGYPLLGRSGISAPSCLGVIILLSIPALALIMAALRSSGIITRPALAGAAAGLLAGALGAAAYVLACRNDGGLFVAVWYGLALSLVAALGALVGRKWLAW